MLSYGEVAEDLPSTSPHPIEPTESEPMPHIPRGDRHNLRYVRDMLEQLAVVAGAEGGPFLVYLIDLAREEAAEKLRRNEILISGEERHASP
jgi:hypothetical protein